MSESLPTSAWRCLHALAEGWTLKSHRYLDGRKEYRLHSLEDEEPQEVSWETVDSLRRQGLIESNKKFPAATYLLTDRGREAVTRLGQDPRDLPLTTSGWN